MGFLDFSQSAREPCCIDLGKHCPEICHSVTAETFLFFLPVLSKILTETSSVRQVAEAGRGLDFGPVRGFDNLVLINKQGQTQAPECRVWT